MCITVAQHLLSPSDASKQAPQASGHMRAMRKNSSQNEYDAKKTKQYAFQVHWHRFISKAQTCCILKHIPKTLLPGLYFHLY